MKTLKVLTLIFNFFIIIGAGHGIAFVGIIELMGVSQLVSGEISFDVTGTYDDRLGMVGILSIIGQSCLISSFFLKSPWKSGMTIVGSAVLLLSIFILTKGARDFNLEMISLFFSIPFIGTALTLLINELLMLKRRNMTTKV